MEYTIQKLAKMADISTRTLRYYDEIGLLKPARVNSSGYRIYGRAEVDRLQHILFYRELGIELEKIGQLIHSQDFDAKNTLIEHRKNLLDKRKQLDLLIANIDKTIAETEGRTTMSDKEKFEGFKQKMIDDNEKKYGDEIRAKYGEDTVNKSNQKLSNMTEKEFNEVTALAEEVNKTLAQAFQTGNPSSEIAQKAADLHRQWLSYYWPTYTKEAHAGVAQMYVDDERFTAYYDKEQPGTAQFLRDAVWIYTGMKK